MKGVTTGGVIAFITVLSFMVIWAVPSYHAPSAADMVKQVQAKPVDPEREKLLQEIAKASVASYGLRDTMSDPDSFRLVRVVYKAAKPDTICYVYRARNSFGGYAFGEAVYSDGRMLPHPPPGLSYAHMPPWPVYWDRECKGADTDITADVSSLL